MNTIAGAILLSVAGIVATAAGIHQQFYNLGAPVWQSTASALLLGGVGLFLIFGKKSN